MATRLGPVFKRWGDGNTTIVGESPVYVFNITKPLTSPRAKPKDLFANATPRRVTSSEAIYTYGYQQDNVSLLPRMYAPQSYWGPVSDVSRLKAQKPSGNASYKDLDNAVRLKIKDQNVNLAQSLAEYKQTSSLFLGTARDVIRTFHSLRSGRKIEEFIKILRDPQTRNGRSLSNRWLELQFGWKPLLSDIHGSAETLAYGLKNGFLRFESSKSVENASGSVPYINGPSIYTSQLTRLVRARYRVSAPGIKSLAEIGITNPAAVIWETVPWSFVIDWIIPVGDFLSGLDALTGVSDLKVQRSFYYKSHVQRDLYNSSGNSKLWGSHGELKETESQRFSVDSSLSFGSLRWDPSLTRNRLLNAAALLRQLKR